MRSGDSGCGALIFMGNGSMCCTGVWRESARDPPCSSSTSRSAWTAFWVLIARACSDTGECLLLDDGSGS